MKQSSSSIGQSKSGVYRIPVICVLLLALFLAARFFDSTSAQNTPVASGAPNPQLAFITQIPPSEWKLEGPISKADFNVLLMRHKRENTRLLPGDFNNPNYRAEHFEKLQSPDLIKVELNDSGVEIVRAPISIVLATGYRYMVPLLVKNSRRRNELLRVRTPWMIYEFLVARNSYRGFCLNLNELQLGEIEKAPISFELDDSSDAFDLFLDIRRTGKLRVKLSDPGDEPAAARMYLTASDGLAHMPIGSALRVLGRTEEYYFHARDEFEIDLPSGPATIEAVRGMEYAPVRKTVEIIPGGTVELALHLDHRFPMARRGWYSGDSHIHANCISNEVVDIEDIELQVSAEGLSVANLMVSNSFTDIVHDERFFEGKPNSISRGNRILYWNEEMRSRSMYGHMCFFNLTELVHPLFTGFPNTQHYEDYPANYAQAKKARAQNGAVTYAHPGVRPNFQGIGRGGAREFPVDLALGEIDALDVLSHLGEDTSTEIWYRALNCGFRCAISAGTDSFTNLTFGQVPGGLRVYVNVPGEFSYARWIDNYKKGKSFVTNGPVLTFAVEGQGPGEEIHYPGAGGPVRIKVEAEVHTLVPVEKLELLVNGSVVATKPAEGDGTHVRIEQRVELAESSWIAARATGPGHRLITNDPEAFAHSSPVYCYLGNQPISSPEDARFWADWIEQLIADVKQRGTFATSARRDSVVSLFRKAQRKYQEMAGQK